MDHPESGVGPCASPARQLATLFIVIAPFVALFFAIYQFWGHGISWLELTLFVSFYLLSGLGITIGFHRLFTHRSFETVRPVELGLAVAGSMAFEGPLLEWCANHRCHHQYSDHDDDPHSPNTGARGFLNVLGSAFHAHVGWLFTTYHPEIDRYVPDLKADKTLKLFSDLFLVFAIGGLVLPGVIAGLVTQSWAGAALGMLWGGFVRVFFIHHVTWSINSVCHMWGARDFDSRDHSRNNAIFGVLAMGEGWHNNHHAFPTSARHGLRWWQFDISYILIRALELSRLAWKVRTPSAESMAAKRIVTTPKPVAAAAPIHLPSPLTRPASGAAAP